MHNGGDMQDMIAREMMKFENFEKEIIPFSLFFWDFFFLVNYAYFIITYIHCPFSAFLCKRISISFEFNVHRILSIKYDYIFLVHHLRLEERY